MKKPFVACLLGGLLLVCGALPVRAAPISFDFEDGTQGWDLLGAQRVETHVLGGSHAVLGSDGDRLRLELDLTNAQSLTLEQLRVSPLRERTNLVTVLIFGKDANGNERFGRDRDGVSLIADESDPFRNPDLRAFDVSGFTGTAFLFVAWNQLACDPGDPSSCAGTNFAGYVDNITFVPVPESATAGSLGLGILTVLIVRRFRAPV